MMDQVSKVIEIVNVFLHRAAWFHALAEMIGSSPRSLSRKFKQATGYSPIDYLIQFRLFKAKEMLLHTDATLDEIAAGIGYPDGYYFGCMFKKHTGLSPLQFKEKTSAPLYWPDLHQVWREMTFSEAGVEGMFILMVIIIINISMEGQTI